MTARISDLKRFAVHDGDGIRTTVFFKGCPLKCLWCHNPESISFAPQTALYKHKCLGCGECKKDSFLSENCPGDAQVYYGKEYSVEDLLPLLLEDVAFYEESGGGVTLSGGECLCQAEFCAELLKALKKKGISTAVDTCGFVSRQAFDAVLPYTDVFLYDLKAFDEKVHLRCTGKSNKQILENLLYLNSVGAKVEIRIPYVPRYNSDQMEKLASFVKPLTCVKKVKILPYHNLAGSKYEALAMENTLPDLLPTDEQIQKAQSLFA